MPAHAGHAIRWTPRDAASRSRTEMLRSVRRRRFMVERAGLTYEVRRVQYDGEDHAHSFPAFGPERADSWGVYFVDGATGQLDHVLDAGTFDGAAVVARDLAEG